MYILFESSVYVLSMSAMCILSEPAIKLPVDFSSLTLYIIIICCECGSQPLVVNHMRAAVGLQEDIYEKVQGAKILSDLVVNSP